MREGKIEEVYDGNLLPEKKSVVQKCKNGRILGKMAGGYGGKLWRKVARTNEGMNEGAKEGAHEGEQIEEIYDGEPTAEEEKRQPP